MGDHLAVFDTTLAETHQWLKGVAHELSPCGRCGREAWRDFR